MFLRPRQGRALTVNSTVPTANWAGAAPRQSVLIVDDSPTDLLYLTRVLERPDRHIISAHSGEEALQVLKGFECALVLLDIHLDGLNGFQTAEKIRAEERTRQDRKSVV